MSKPDYLAKITEVAAVYGVGQNLENRLRSMWLSFESDAANLAIPFDILGSVPMIFRNRITDLIEILYQTGSGNPHTDCEQIRAKDKEYGGSWHRRGGTGAFHALARKGDRLLEQLDIHTTITAAKQDKNSSEAILDTLGDLRRYLILVEAWHVATEPTLLGCLCTGPDVGGCPFHGPF